MDKLSYRTSPAKVNAPKNWFVVDAEGEIVGRLASKIAAVLRGKHRPDFTPHVDNGDYVIVLNVDKIRFTGNKMNQKNYLTFSLYPGGQKSERADKILTRKPDYIMAEAIKGMLPKTKLGRAQMKKLFLYTGATHPHTAQKPQSL